uniref:SHSP domain-containing protein n=1 Tax=Spongospora subterranea TaxID=70186 RepID=A0A0H5R2Q1_9EUKA|eukprot:CRZ08488.1 hypothetical protein [Spongospora subterranea]
MSLSLFDFHRDLDRQLFGGGQMKSGPTPQMKMELREYDKNYQVSVEVPGIPKEEIKLSVDGGVLTVSAEHKEQRSGENKEEHIHFSERSYGYSSRSIRLPRNASTEKIGAEYKNGVLTIEIPKTDPKAASNLIQIK